MAERDKLEKCRSGYTDSETAAFLSVSDVDGVILLICELLSACGAVVSPGEGVADALAAEQVAAFRRDHEPSALNDLETMDRRDSGEKHSWALLINL